LNSSLNKGSTFLFIKECRLEAFNNVHTRTLSVHT
jgi:hypothetical protein